jgi:type II secretory pathway component PulK
MIGSQKNPRGFATVLAVASLLLVGISIAGLMRRFSTEARRTQEETDRAQLRQMVIAGAMSKPNAVVQLPDVLSGMKGQLAVRFEKDGSTVTAQLDGRHERFVLEAHK